MPIPYDKWAYITAQQQEQRLLKQMQVWGSPLPPQLPRTATRAEVDAEYDFCRIPVSMTATRPPKTTREVYAYHEAAYQLTKRGVPFTLEALGKLAQSLCR